MKDKHNILSKLVITISVITVVIMFFAFNSAPQGSTQEKTKKPNFVLIMADDLGYSDISCYGSRTIHTPYLDRLAAEGMRFMDYHSNGAVCSPTRAALLTGKYQQRTGIEGVITAAYHRKVGLALKEITLAEALKKEGYVTGMFGKWHLGYAEKYNPCHQGFDEFKGYVSGNVDYFSHIDQEGYFDWWKNTTLKDDKGYSTDLVTRYGIDFIKRHKKEPFFLYLPYETPHYPYQGRHSKPFRTKGSKKASNKAVPADSIPGIYKEMVEVMDGDIGRIIQVLKDMHLTGKTFVFFCSDNGGVRNYGQHNLPLRGWKGQLYEGGHRVPAIAWWPGKIRAGVKSDETIMSMDIFPTFLDLANETPMKELDGISFKEILLKEGTMPERSLFWRFHHVKVIRQGDWKLIIPETKTIQNNIELYNLKNDLSETKNLAAQKPEVVKTLQEKLNKWEKEVTKGVTFLSQ